MFDMDNLGQNEDENKLNILSDVVEADPIVQNIDTGLHNDFNTSLRAHKE